ncbi:hypothetical protein BK721_12940 [Bacillus thuringiensis serovar nigeriensis]|uniref:restriction endonuclease subunit S n=1 Tax=Bacillus thuringiensis TaxID=1428 RepID=UPI000A371667|nr:restriction endonuclease subunit S [Bacillus thuringiensis]MEC3429859.1 restriction endonuclease subunit S [Bacillus cereus]MRC95620.1 hypothetical protein [Bacillus thuringiensis]OTX20457.1 hypothetical protein BK721_12940 [Bacillus thuringiensis serovar nigeriensis]
MSKVQAGYKSTELGDIPEGWEIVSLADVADPNKPYALTGGPFGSDLKSEEYTELGVRIIQLQNIKEGYFSNKYKIYTSEAKANQLFNCNIFPNDIIIAKMAEPVARACIIPKLHERYLMASDGIRLSVNEEDYSTKYVMYAINSSYFRQQAIDNSTGTTRLRIGLKMLKRLKLLKPSKEEQQKIATILSTVDKDIEKTEAIIQQTEKVKKGLMQQLLTKGIGHTKFKKTDIGDIPEEWKVLTFEEISDLITKGTTPTTYGFNYEDTGVNFIRTENIDEQGKVVKDNMKKISLAAHQKLKRSILKEKDILFSIAGVGLGQCTIVKEDLLPANTNQALAIIRISSPLFDHHFVYTLLLSHYITKQIKVVSTIGAQPNISLKQIGDFKIPIPTLKEQKRIVDILSSVGEKIQHEKVKLDTLQTLKTGLMQSLLTGKVRVGVDEAGVAHV